MLRAVTARHRRPRATTACRDDIWRNCEEPRAADPGSENIIFDLHLHSRFGEMRLDEIPTFEVAGLRSVLVQRKLSESASTTSSRSCRSR
jgi:hypothetical protein